MSEKNLITADEIRALLGRSLKQVEIDNFDLYLEISILRLNDLLCIKLEELTEIPADLKLLIARMFATIASEQSAAASYGINKKQVEDFSISYEANVRTPMEEFVAQNATIIDKYGKCQGCIRSGKVIHGNCFRCI